MLYEKVGRMAAKGVECDTSLSLKELVDWEDDGGFWRRVVRRKEGICILYMWKRHKKAVKKWSMLIE